MIRRVSTVRSKAKATFWRAHKNKKRNNMKELMLTKAMMAALTVCAVTSLALADDFKTNNGKEYKNATVSRVEPDGIVVRTKVGICRRNASI